MAPFLNYLPQFSDRFSKRVDLFKMKNYLLASAILLFSGSCTMVYFTSDQPAGVPALKEVPASLIGIYTSETDSLVIEKGSFTTIEHNDRTTAVKDSMAAGISHGRDGKWKFRGPDAANYYVREVKNDTIYYVKRKRISYTLGPDTLLKTYKGNYFLSMRHEKVWMVYQVSTAKKGNIAIEIPYLDKKEAEEMARRMGDKNIDSTGFYSSVTPFSRYGTDDRGYVTTASPDELIRLTKKGLFKPIGTFKKVD